MPFTLFHMGPGIFIKALLQGSFSLMVFGWAQIITDIQPLIALITGEGQLHGFTHTYVGATLLAIFSALTGKHLSEYGLRVLKIPRYQHTNIAWWVVFVSAFVGTYSHIVLDSIMHHDMEPFYPFWTSNQLLGVLSISELHQLCIYGGLLGAAIYYLAQIYVSKQRVKSQNC